MSTAVRQFGMGPFLQAHRARLRLHQMQVAQRSGVSQRMISAVELGRVKLPSAHIRRALASAYGVNQLDLLIAAGEVTEDEVQHWVRVHQPILPPATAARPEDV